MRSIKKSLCILSVPVLMLTACGGSNPSSSNNSSNSGSSTTTSTNNVVSGSMWEVFSPSNKLSAQIILDDFGSIHYNVRDNDMTIINDSLLGLDFQEANLNQMLSFVSKEEKHIDLEYSNKSGKHSTVKDECNEITLTFLETSYYLDLTFRAYDDGYAFRYGVRNVNGGEGTLTINQELTQFALPENSVTWIEAYTTNKADLNCFSYEEPYVRKKSTSLSNKYISMPMIYNIKGTDEYSMITEAGLIGSNFYGSFLKEMPENEETGILQTVHTPAGVANPDNVISYPFTSPWRVGAAGSLADVTESEIVEKVYDDVVPYRPDNYDELTVEEQQVYEYDWVEPGVTAWNWLIYTGTKPQNDWDLQREYVDLAQKMGWKYTILDGGWNSSLDVTLFKEFIKYAHDRGVKVLVWCNALNDFANGNVSILKTKLNTWKSYGVDGIKIDFFDGQNATNPSHQGEDIETIKWYETIYQETAKRQMVVNCHGSNKPTGERRVYPNVINREGIRGNEFHNVDSSITVNSMFTRTIVGPSDFTPVVTPLSKGLTKAQQIALSFLYESGAPSMADYSSTYSNADINDFYSQLPAAWDDMHFINGAPDEYYCAARKSGNDWYVGAINTYSEREISIDFSFLDDGVYDAIIIKDGSDYKSIVREEKQIKKGDVLNFNLLGNGGLTVKLMKK